MILIRNTQRTIPIDSKKIEYTAQQILDLLDYGDFDLGIWFTTDKTIRGYNRTYRHKDKPTDILSFPYYPELKAGEHIIASSDDEKNLGDLILSPSYIMEDAQRLNVSFDDRIRRLLVHGVCHLLGYDHIEDDDYAVMLKKEMSLLRRIKK